MGAPEPLTIHATATRNTAERSATGGDDVSITITLTGAQPRIVRLVDVLVKALDQVMDAEGQRVQPTESLPEN